MPKNRMMTGRVIMIEPVITTFGRGVGLLKIQLILMGMV
jgi:hypothetical protein